VGLAAGAARRVRGRDEDEPHEGYEGAVPRDRSVVRSLAASQASELEGELRRAASDLSGSPRGGGLGAARPR
jgi:hypothetical protein